MANEAYLFGLIPTYYLLLYSFTPLLLYSLPLTPYSFTPLLLYSLLLTPYSLLLTPLLLTTYSLLLYSLPLTPYHLLLTPLLLTTYSLLLTPYTPYLVTRGVLCVSLSC